MQAIISQTAIFDIFRHRQPAQAEGNNLKCLDENLKG